MSFRAARALNFRQVFLNTEHFAEEVIYMPAGGAERTITAIVRARRQSGALQQHVTTDEDVLDVKVLRDETDGVETPQRGDRLRLPTDPPGKQYSFSGEITDETPHSFGLVFIHRRPHEVGRQTLAR